MDANSAFILDTRKAPQTPVPPAEARWRAACGQAAVYCDPPFTIIPKDQGPGRLFNRPLHLKIDPGSKVTGLVILDGACVVWAAELTHRGARINTRLQSRRVLQRGRRSRKTHYHEPRFNNRRRAEGWLPPSLMHRVQTTVSWVDRLCRYAPIDAMRVENVRFDRQRIRNPEISGVEYQQGTLAGYKLREYLLVKFIHTCVYCGTWDVRLEIKPVVARPRGGVFKRPDNKAIACHDSTLFCLSSCVTKLLHIQHTTARRTTQRFDYRFAPRMLVECVGPRRVRSALPEMLRAMSYTGAWLRSITGQLHTRPLEGKHYARISSLPARSVRAHPYFVDAP